MKRTQKGIKLTFEQNLSCPFHKAKEIKGSTPQEQFHAVNICIKDGLDYLSLKTKVDSPIPKVIEFDDDRFVLGCVKSGWVNIQVDPNNLEKVDPGHYFQFSGSEFAIEQTSKDSVQLNLFICSREFAKLLLQLDPEQNNQNLKEYAHKKAKCSFKCIQMNETTLTAANKIRPDQINNIKHRLQLEGYTLSWMSEVICTPLPSSTSLSHSINANDRDAIEHIVKKFKKNPGYEYSIDELCSIGHINEHKLKMAFKHIHGKTPFSYLREVRMDHAAELLREDRFSVIQVANEVGYSNASHFARAFKDQHGLLPKAYQCLYRS